MSILVPIETAKPNFFQRKTTYFHQFLFLNPPEVLNRFLRERNHQIHQQQTRALLNHKHLPCPCSLAAGEGNFEETQRTLDLYETPEALRAASAGTRAGWGS